MAFQNNVVSIGTVDTIVFEASSTNEGSVHSLILHNSTGSQISVTLKLFRYTVGTTDPFFTTQIGAGESFTFPKPINLAVLDRVVSYASAVGVVAFVSAYSSKAPLVKGFVARGTWSSTATYRALDIVNYTDGVTGETKSYLCVTQNINDAPPSVNWMELFQASTVWDQIVAKPTTFTPSAHTHSAADVGAATAAQGAKADTAVQPADVGQADLPTIRPSLNLDFANAGAVDSRVTFTRASAATRFNKRGLLETVAANVPRIDYDPVTGECKGLLIEEARTNLLTYSSEFDNAAWVKANATVTANAATAPDGTLTADTLDGLVNVLVYQVTSVASSTIYTFSYLFKLGTAIDNRYAVYDHTNSAWIVPETIVSSVEEFGGGWKRVSVTFTTPTTCTQVRVYPLRASTGTTYLWGAQLEEGSFPTSIIQTGSTAATRAADVAVMTGANFSDWYRADEGTVVVDCALSGFAAGVSPYALSVQDADASNRIAARRQSITGKFQFLVYSSGATVADVGTAPAISAGDMLQTAFAYKANDFAATSNGSAPRIDVDGGVPSGVDRLCLGSLSGGSLFLNGHIRRLCYFGKRLSNATLQALTAE